MRKLRYREIPTASEKWSQAWNLATWLQSRGFSSPRLHSCPSLLPTPDTWGWPILVPLPLSQIGKMASAWGPLTCAAAAFQMASPGPPPPPRLLPSPHLLPALRSVWLSSHYNFQGHLLIYSSPPHTPMPQHTHLSSTAPQLPTLLRKKWFDTHEQQGHLCPVLSTAGES